MDPPPPLILRISNPADVAMARGPAKAMALAIGFSDRDGEEIALAVTELASNLLKHATHGILTLRAVASNGIAGMEVESLDRGPGIPDLKLALADGFSTAGSLGHGLGTVNRAMDDLEIVSPVQARAGTQIVCRRWVRPDPASALGPCPLAFGVATRAHPRMTVNGDAFVIRRWGGGALVAVIDGLGHGPLAHRAAQAARAYVEDHSHQPLADIFRGVARTCHGGRGVVMAMARFDWPPGRLTFASVGNVEARVFGSSEPMGLSVRRGVLGTNATDPLVTERPWRPGYLMVLHSDGLSTPWHLRDFPHLAELPAPDLAHGLLRALARDDDDATVMVVRDNA